MAKLDILEEKMSEHLKLVKEDSYMKLCIIQLIEKKYKKISIIIILLNESN